MVEVAHSLGHPEIKERRIEKWTTEDRLLPQMQRVGYEGKRPVWVYPAGADHQLAGLLRWAETTRRLDAIRVVLWAEGYDISVEAARASMVARLDEVAAATTEQLRRFEPDASLDQPESPATRRALQALARQAAGRRPRGSKRPPIPRGAARLSARERIRAIDLILSTFLALPDGAATDTDWATVERLTDLSYGRRGVSPQFKWLEGLASETIGAVLPRFTFPAIRNALTQATDLQLEQARLLAQILIRNLPLAAGALQVLGQPHAAGLDHLLALNDLGAEGVTILLAGLVLVSTQLDLAQNFRELAVQLRAAGFRDLEQLRDLSDQARQEALSRIENEQTRRQLKRLLDMATPADRRFSTPPSPPNRPPKEERTATS